MANHSPGEELYHTSMEASEDAGRPRSMELVTGRADSPLRQHYGRRRQCTSLPSETLGQVQLIAAGQVSTRRLLSSPLSRDAGVEAGATVDRRRQGG